MNAGTPIQNFEKATEIPSESLHIVEMGDGSGTKVVSQEILAKEIGKAIKVGNLEELETKNKENLVDAINEAAQSGSGGASVDILDTPEEIEANTELGKLAGAMAMKEMFGALNDKLQGFEPVIDENTGKITGYKTTLGGADTVFPFKNNLELTQYTKDYNNKSSSLDVPSSPKIVTVNVSSSQSNLNNGDTGVWISKEINGLGADLFMGKVSISVNENLVSVSSSVFAYGRIRAWC